MKHDTDKLRILGDILNSMSFEELHTVYDSLPQIIKVREKEEKCT